jgi:hypothetical protein
MTDLPRTARGKRPAFHENASIDRLVGIVFALMSEVGVLRDRVDTLELLGERAGWLGAGELDAFVPDQPTRERREACARRISAACSTSLEAEIEGLEQDGDYWETVKGIETARAEGA